MDEPLDEAEIDEILAALRAGATVSTPGSRCHSDFGHDAEGWYRIDFDEGATACARIDEHTVRAQLRSTPDIGVTLLRQRRWLALRHAAAAQDTGRALAALTDWQHYGGSADSARLVAATLAADETPLDAATGDTLRRLLADGTLFHLTMDLHGWPRGPGSAAGCLAFIDRLLQRLGASAADPTDLRGRLHQRIAAESASS